MDKFCEGLNVLKVSVNSVFQNKEPWQISAITATIILSSVYFWDVFSQDESIYGRLKKRAFKLARHIPAVQEKINQEVQKTTQSFEDEIIHITKDIPYITKLPSDGYTDEKVLSTVDEYLKIGNYKWQEGRVSGAVYYFDTKLIELVTAVYGKASYTNPLHPDIFPGVCKMEAEVVRMTANLFNGNSKSCGTMTTGGTESIIMACKAYRDYAKEEKGITQPNIVIPRTAHSAFDKAAQYLKLHVNNVDIDPVTTTVNLKKMERAINSNTIMLVASAPNYPYGTMDDVEGVAALGRKYNIPVHVDACLGGFVIIFMRKAGYDLPPFDFKVPGVTSISADTHKYGFAPKGSSVILYSERKFRNHQYTVTTEWPGGVYGSPSVNGSRAGGIIAATWATLLHFGEDGYIEATKKIIETAKYIERELRKLNGIYVFGTPKTTVVAIGSNNFDIFLLSDLLCNAGWNLNALQFPSGIHLCVTYTHTKEGVADKFLADVKSNLATVMLNPEKPLEGRMAVYGIAQKVPDRTVVGEFTKCYLDSMFYTPDAE